MDVGKQVRLHQFTRKDWNIILPVDHGFTMGPIRGLASIAETAELSNLEGIDGLIAHPGVIKKIVANSVGYSKAMPGFIVQLTGMSDESRDVDTKQFITSVKKANRYGASAVSIQLNFNASNFSKNIQHLASVIEQVDEFGLPVLVMLYDKISQSEEEYVCRIRKYVRLCSELSVDMVKIAFPESPGGIARILEGLSEEIAVFFAGGNLKSQNEFLENINHARQFGAKGLCAGRNIFERNDQDHIIRLIKKTAQKEAVYEVS